MKKTILIAGSAVGVGIVAVFLVFVFLTPSQDYAVSVDPLVSKGDFGTYTHVFIKNTGRLPVTNLKVNYGNGKSDSIPVLEPGDRVMLSPPDGSDLNLVKVTADNGINVTKSYAVPTSAPMIGNGGFGQ
ncbi:MAG: hypothetical protein KGI25_03935 [Thaumarchaeota archaeon]|nr:hypothetical protein [Nitrososphaerota archaeon]